MVDFAERCRFLLVVLFIYLIQPVYSNEDQPSEDSNNLEQKSDEKVRVNVYSSSSTKANEFLSYEKCIQRMKCPINRKEECSEECEAGNTEEEVEEHLELFVNERQHIAKRPPKPKSETTNSKKRARKDPPAVETTEETNSSSVEKTEL